LENSGRIKKELEKLSDTLDSSFSDVSIVLAAGHGKRIKSERSKMLHEIWGKPTVWRVCKAAIEGLSSPNQIIVVGKKALEVANALGKKRNRVFVFQPEQKGTGDAVKKAIEHKSLLSFRGNVYVFPGDMGLLSPDTVKNFKAKFNSSDCDMMVMTGIFKGDPRDNYYGRIVKSKIFPNEVIEIKEHKDILAMEDEVEYRVNFRGNIESFTKNELLNIKEFNTGVYAFKIEPFKKHVYEITDKNIQGEIYITDLIKIYNDHGLKVGTSPVTNNDLVIAFNVKSVLKKMEDTFRNIIYNRLKDIITIDDPEDFFIAEETVERIIDLDKKYPMLDISIGKGAYIGESIVINRGLQIGRNSVLTGNVRFGENVKVEDDVVMSTYPNQWIIIGNNAHIYRNNVIKGNITIGNNVRIETGVRITGSDDSPVKIGNNVLIKGTSYILGSVIEDDILIEHSILKQVYVERVVKKDGSIQPIRYIIPYPEGLDSISQLKYE